MPGYTFLRYNLNPEYGETDITNNVDEITFSGFTLTESNIDKMVAFFLRYGHQFKSLLFSHVTCENSKVEKNLLTLIDKLCPHIATIKFSKCKFQSQYADEVVAIIKNHPPLLHLQLFYAPCSEADYLKIIASVGGHNYLRELTLTPATGTESTRKARTSLTSYLERNKNSAIKSGLDAVDIIYSAVKAAAEPQDKTTLIENCQRLLGAIKIAKSLPDNPEVKAAEEKINTLLKDLKARVRKILIDELKHSPSETLEIPLAGFDYEDHIIDEIVIPHISSNQYLKRIVLADEITVLFPFVYDRYYGTLDAISRLGKTLLECYNRVTAIEGLPDRNIKHSGDYFGDLDKALKRNQRWEEHTEAQNVAFRHLGKLDVGFFAPNSLQHAFCIAVELNAAAFPNPGQASQFLRVVESYFNENIFKGIEDGSPEEQMKKHAELGQFFVGVSESILNGSDYGFERFRRFSSLVLSVIEKYVAHHFIKLIALCHGDNSSTEAYVQQVLSGLYKIGEGVGKLYPANCNGAEAKEIFNRTVSVTVDACIKTKAIEYRDDKIRLQIYSIFSNKSDFGDFGYKVFDLYASKPVPSLPYPLCFISHVVQLNSLEYKIDYFEQCLAYAKQQRLFYRLRAHQRLFGYLMGINFVERPKDYWLSYEAETQVWADFPVREACVKLYFEKYIADLATDIKGNNLNSCYSYLCDFLDFAVQRYPQYAAKVLNTYAMLVAQMDLRDAKVDNRLADLKSKVSGLGWRYRDEAKAELIKIIIQLARTNNFVFLAYAVELARELASTRLLEDALRSAEQPLQTQIIRTLFKIYQTKIIVITEQATNQDEKDLLFNAKNAKTVADLLRALEKHENNHLVPTVILSLASSNFASLMQIKNEIAIIPADLQKRPVDVDEALISAPQVARQNTFILDLQSPPPAAVASANAAPPSVFQSEKVDGPVASIYPQTYRRNTDQTLVVPAAAEVLFPAAATLPALSASACPPAAMSSPEDPAVVLNTIHAFFTPVARYTEEVLPVIYTDPQRVEDEFARVPSLLDGEPYFTPVLPSVPTTEPRTPIGVYKNPKP